MTLPPLPVDDVALDLYDNALRGDTRSSVRDVLAMYAELGGSDLAAYVTRGVESGVVIELRDPTYHPNDLIRALITEIRRLRETP